MSDENSKRNFLMILSALLIGGTVTAAISYYVAERYIESTHAGAPLQNAGGLKPPRQLV